MMPDQRPSAERSTKHFLAILGGCLLALVLLHHAIFRAPAQERILDLRERVHRAQLEAHGRDRRRTRIPEFERRAAQAKKELGERIARIARVRDRPLLLEAVSNRARATGLSIVGFRPGEEKEKEAYAIVPLEIRLEGDFHNLIRFLRALVRIPRVNRLGNLTLSQDAGPTPLSISLEILTYRLPPSWLEPPTARGGNAGPPENRIVPSYTEPPPAGDDESLGSIRNPFRPVELSPCRAPENALEGYDLTELKLVGIIWEAKDPKGLVMDGSRSGHIIEPGSPIGNRGGIVKSITPTSVTVEERPGGAATAPRALRLNLPEFGSGPTADSPGMNPGTLMDAGRRGRGKCGLVGVRILR